MIQGMLWRMRVMAGMALMAAGVTCLGQQGAPGLPAGMTRKMGVDAGSGIAYALVSISGKASGEAPAGTPPRLTAQCTRDSNGKLRFELLADAGGGPELTFVAPWKATQDSLYPPRLEKTQVVMEFLGYMKVKPVKRQWEYLVEMPDELRYATPGLASTNMEQVMFYLQYLRALPTLRLTVPGKGTVEFETAKWQEMVRAEPLCRASGL